MPPLFRNKGFSLTEILIVLGILTLLMTISIPYLRNFQPNLQLNAAVRNLTTDIRYAQQQTITEQVVYGVKFYPAAKSYEILKLDIATTTIKSFTLPSEVEFQSVTGFTDDIVRFNSYGAAHETGTIILKNSSNQTKIIVVKPSGYVQIQ